MNVHQKKKRLLTHYSRTMNFHCSNKYIQVQMNTSTALHHEQRPTSKNIIVKSNVGCATRPADLPSVTLARLQGHVPLSSLNSHRDKAFKSAIRPKHIRCTSPSFPEVSRGKENREQVGAAQTSMEQSNKRLSKGPMSQKNKMSYVLLAVRRSTRKEERHSHANSMQEARKTGTLSSSIDSPSSQSSEVRNDTLQQKLMVIDSMIARHNQPKNTWIDGKALLSNCTCTEEWIQKSCTSSSSQSKLPISSDIETTCMDYDRMETLLKQRRNLLELEILNLTSARAQLRDELSILNKIHHTSSGKPH
jgi:hypothetical protein